MNARFQARDLSANDALGSRGIVLPVSAGAADYRALSQCLSIFTAFVTANRTVLVEFDITARQYACLVEAQCGAAEGAISIGELARRLRVRHNTAVGTVTRLCDKGHMVRTRDTADRRKVRLGVTTKGREVLDRITSRYWQTLREIEPGLFSQAG